MHDVSLSLSQPMSLSSYFLSPVQLGRGSDGPVLVGTWHLSRPNQTKLPAKQFYKLVHTPSRSAEMEGKKGNRNPSSVWSMYPNIHVINLQEEKLFTSSQWLGLTFHYTHQTLQPFPGI